MRIYHKKLYNTLLLFFITVFALLLCGAKGIKSYMERSAYAETYRQQEERFGISLWNGVTDASPGDYQICINWWCQERDSHYVLFVPNGMKNERLYWLFTGQTQMLLDDVKIESGDWFHCDSGMHKLVFAENGEEKHCTLEILYTAPITTLFLETDSGSLSFLHESKEHHEGGSYLFLDENGKPCYEGRIDDIHCRGNSSYEETDKKSYRIELQDKCDLFGMGEDKDWILTANAFDDTLLRNVLAFDIAKKLRLAYTPSVTYTDVYVNGDFVGNYLLSQPVEIGKNRVNIEDLQKNMKKLNESKELSEYEFFMEQQGRLFSTKGYRIENEPQDISGGYLLELETSDRYGLESSGFLTSRMQPVVFASPKYASYNQVSYVADLYQDFEDAMFAEDGYSPYTGKHYSEYIDMESFARKYLLEELVKNLDASFTSQYIYKPSDAVSTKFFAGPAWDYDKSIAASGITNDGVNLHDAEGFYACLRETDSDIWYALYQHEDFRALTAQIFFDELAPQIRAEFNQMVDDYSHSIEASNICNIIRWNTFSQYSELDEKLECHALKIEELKDFMQRRVDFLESEWEDMRREE
ncbi:MAG: CotH kinase family protein [Lachnospiraceae bacterium]|nr:CotH kinase family protein [Lachnospiraceae bacterium]